MQATPDQYPALVERFSARYREISQLLMKVQTEQVNLRQALMQESENYYLTISYSPSRELEAKVFGAASTALMVALLDEKQDFSVLKTYGVMVPVALRLMGLPDDPDIKKLVMQKHKLTEL